MVQFLSFIGSQGINEYIIYDPKETQREERVNAAFWLDNTLGLLSFTVCLALVPLFTTYYQYEQLGLIIILMALKFPFDALSRVPDALLKKNLDFKAIELRDAVIQMAVALGGIGMALMGYGVWSLVIPGLLASPLRAVVIFRLSSWRPKWNLGLPHWKEVFGYSKNIIGSTLTSFVISQGDTLLIGKLLGTSLLGVYNIAWRSSNLVSRSLMQVSHKLTLPTLARSSANIDKLRVNIKKILRVISVASFPPIVALMVLADVFILTLYGEKWMAAILPLRILLIYAMRFTVSTPIGAVFKAVGKPEINFRIGLTVVPFYLLGIYWGGHYGIVGVATGVTVVRTLSGFLSFYLAGRVLNESYIAVSRPLIQPLILSVCMGGILLLVRLILHLTGVDSPVMVLLVSTVSGIVSIWLLMRYIFRSLSDELLGYLSHILPARVSSLASRMLNSPMA